MTTQAAPAIGTERRDHAWHRQRWGVIVGGFAAAFLIGSVVAWLAQAASGDWDQGLPWEREMLLAIPRPMPPLLDMFLYLAPWAGTNISLIPFVFIAIVWLWRSRHRVDLAMRLAVVQVGSYLLNPALKYAFERARPDLVPRRGWYGWASYPSGHAIAGVAVLFTVALMLHRERGWRWPYAVAAVLSGANMYSRVYLGVHWPLDVVGGALVGLVWLLATAWAFRTRSES